VQTCSLFYTVAGNVLARSMITLTVSPLPSLAKQHDGRRCLTSAANTSEVKYGSPNSEEGRGEKIRSGSDVPKPGSKQRAQAYNHIPY
jgi:hypothetical protein